MTRSTKDSTIFFNLEGCRSSQNRGPMQSSLQDTHHTQKFTEKNKNKKQVTNTSLIDMTFSQKSMFFQTIFWGVFPN